MAKATGGHNALRSGMTMTILAIPVAPPMGGCVQETIIRWISKSPRVGALFGEMGRRNVAYNGTYCAKTAEPIEPPFGVAPVRAHWRHLTNTVEDFPVGLT